MSRRGWIALGVIGAVWLVTLFALIGVAGYAFGPRETVWDEKLVQGTGDRKVAVVRISGEITGGAGGGLLEAATTGSRSVISQLRQAGRDDDVAAVVVRLETPGGEVVASDDIYRAVRRLVDSKPVVASMGDVAASGGYYIASATQRIVASPATWTGSIGVIAVLPNVTGAQEKLGIRANVVKSGAFKDAGSPFRDLRPEEQEYFQGLIDEAYGTFLDAVARGRSRPVDEIRGLADGRIFSGTQALANGLVDELGDLDTAYDAALRVARIDREDARLVEYTPRPTLFDLALGVAGRSPVAEAKRELGLGFGMKYLFLPGT